MIVRLMGDGQYRVDDGLKERLNELDHEVAKAVEADDEAALWQGTRRARRRGARARRAAAPTTRSAVRRDRPARGPVARGGPRADDRRGAHPRSAGAGAVSREVVLVARPDGEPKESDFELRATDDARAGRRRGCRPQRLRLGRPVHARSHDRREDVRPAVRARRRDRRRGGRARRRVEARWLRRG